MLEWSKKSEFNSFNSWKGLLYSEWYESIRDWKNGVIKSPLPPIEASLDPIHACNLMCDFCNAHRYLVENESVNLNRIPDDHLIKLIKFLGKWGVKAICFGGGGEPTLHTNLAKALYVCKESGMDASIATNGTNFSDELIEAISDTCRWVGVSVDSSTRKTYKIGRKSDKFLKVISNITKLSNYCSSKNSRCEVAYKFLIFDYNQNEIFAAAKLAKKIGVKDFHVRPADLSHQGMGELKNKSKGYNVKKVLKQFEKCHEIEDDSFRVFSVCHKFDKNFKPIKNFSQCYASPCGIQLCAEGSVFLCPDQRFVDFYKLGDHYPDPENILNFWGSNKHYDLVFKYGKENCTSRCTFSPYCKQCEELFIKDSDPMCKFFI